MSQIRMSTASPSTPTLSASPTALHPDVPAQVEADLAATLAQYGIELIELDGPFDGLFGHYYLEPDGRRLLVAPAGQDSATTLWAARTLIAHQQVMPV
ncbi:hypothetical protein [Streptomyces reticuliscabiei]|uniref:hypothetical protein n=1 Tax=Streptomyces reticuliscabiei TaxID=146821 RepID=UPI000A36C971|nr:hypothetical protein [Streptomyces reticuliscabiei]